MALPEFLNPFVLPVEQYAAERQDSVDLYVPEAGQARPAVVFVHGGPASGRSTSDASRLAGVSGVWVRCVAASYPVLAPLPGRTVAPGFEPAEAVAAAGSLPIVLTRAGRERPEVAATVEAFVAAAHSCQARLQVIDVPHGQHGFDMLDHTDESRKAVENALDAVFTELT